MTQSKTSGQKEYDELLERYINLSQDYSYWCNQIALLLEKSLLKPGDGDSGWAKSTGWDIRKAATESERLAKEISGLLTIARETVNLDWETENVNRGIDQFVTLSENYMEMRRGFMELMMDSRSPIVKGECSSNLKKATLIRKISEGTETVSETDKEDLIMLYMREQRKRDKRWKKWTNTKIGYFFGFKANSVVNRLLQYKTQTSPPDSGG